MTARAMAKSVAAQPRFRLAHSHILRSIQAGRADTGSPCNHFPKSTANACAVAYRRFGSFSMAFMQIAARSAGTFFTKFAND